MTERAKLGRFPRGKRKRSQSMANAIMNPATTHGAIGASLLSQISGGQLDQHDLMLELHELLKEVRSGKLGGVQDMLAAQAFSLDALYVEMMRRALLHIGQYPDAVDRYMRHALKAQAQSRATLEALAKMHQPREQTVRHIHVDNRGGQAVIAETVQTRGEQNGKADEQPHATQSGDAPGASAPLPCPDAIGWGMPSTGDKREEAVPHARRPESRGT